MGDRECIIKINNEVHNMREGSSKDWIGKVNNEVSKMKQGSDESGRWQSRSIYKIPISVIELHKEAYKPQIVSIGPYHHDNPNLKSMEEHKRRALVHFLKRSNNPLERFIEELNPMVQGLKDAYDQLDPKWQNDNDSFLEMMIMDGCFILEILRITTIVADETEKTDYASNDPIFSNHGKLYIVPYLKRDMLMLENQIPMKVLQVLVSIQNDNLLKRDRELVRRILKFYSQTVSPKSFHKINEGLHILDVYRKSLLLEEPHKLKSQSKQKDGNPRIHPGGDEIIRSATELNEAGIIIKKSKTRSLRDISFRKGILRLPLVVVDDSLKSLYLNMMAFERFHVGAGNEVTSYIFFMDNIIDSALDVSLLHSCGIIQNALGSDKAVANLFNSLSKDVTLDPESRLDEVHKEVSAYCQKPWHRWRANLMHTYFTNPWAILSVVAAVFLFALTIVQTVYSILSYNPSPAPSPQ